MAGAGFSLASFIPVNELQAADNSEGNQLELNAFVEVDSTGLITLYAHTPEKGQGIKTSLPMIIAEELGASWNDVSVVNAPFNEERYGEQRAGGSTSTPREWDHMRQAGAAARDMFIAAAAKEMSVPLESLYTEDSKVIHADSGQSLSFASLAIAAASEIVPEIANLVFKNRADYKLLGSRISGVDNPALVIGDDKLFGSDIQVPDMLHAIYEKCPATYGKVKSANLDHVKSLPGVVDAFIIEGNDEVRELLDGVAIVAHSTWQAFQARLQLVVQWDETSASKDNNEKFYTQAMDLARTPWPDNAQTTVTGDVERQFTDRNSTIVESVYRYPYLAHACMEAMNCTAWYHHDTDRIEIWAPSRMPRFIVNSMESVFGISEDKVTIHPMRMGGSFGRRRFTDFACEAVAIAQRVGSPIKLTWTREQDIIHDQYRAGGIYAFKGAVNQKGLVSALQNHLIGPKVREQGTVGTRIGNSEFPALNIENYRAAVSLIESHTPSGSWRAPGSNHTGWAVQSFIAELAHAADRDHIEMLLELMGEPRWLQPGNAGALNTGRAIEVINLVAVKSNWGRKLPPGRAMGFAFHFSHAAHVAEVVELSVDSNKKITIHKITAAVDVGPIINMSGALAQVEGAITDGLSTLFKLEVTMLNGRIQQNNFHQYNVLRMKNAPTNIETHFIQSDYNPTGLGEPSLPPLAPAVCNAIFAANGHRIRIMPISREGYWL